jgi:ABC-type multidrug transport system fused ATPase/permease subunit
VDDQLGAHLNMSILLVIKSFSRLLAVTASAPVFILPGSLIGVFGSIVGQLYVRAQLSVKRERSNAKSPVLAEVNDTLTGLVSIRAFGAQDMFRQQCMDRINKYSHVSVIFWNLNRWVAVRIQVSINDGHNP